MTEHRMCLQDSRLSNLPLDTSLDGLAYIPCEYQREWARFPTEPKVLPVQQLTKTNTATVSKDYYVSPYLNSSPDLMFCGTLDMLMRHAKRF